jgi:hypothetical protein
MAGSWSVGCVAAVAAVAASVFGCGRLDFDPKGSGGDAGSRQCAQWGPFAGLARVDSLNSTLDDWGPTVTADELDVMLYAYPSGDGDVLEATRSDTASAFTTPAVVAALRTPSDERSPALSADGTIVVFASARAGGPGARNLWTAVRANRRATFSAPTLLGNVNISTSKNDFPWLSGDGLRLYFSTDVNGSAGFDIYSAERSSKSADFGAPVPVTALDSLHDDFIGLSPDELEAFVSSNRSGNGDFDILRATRPDRGAAFGTPTPVTELNSARDDVLAHLSGDGATVYFNYDTQIAGGSNADIWRATRSCVAH